MPTLLIKHAHLLVTMDASRNEIFDGGMFIKDGIIEKVGPTNTLPQEADDVFDFTDHIIMPGLINTHHHFYQTLTRAFPAAQNANLFNWLKTLYPIWAKMTPEDIYVSTQTALAELALSGCTTASDHLYLFPNGSKLDDEIEAASAMGMRLHATRGSMSLGESKGGLPPDSVVDDEDAILKDSQRLIERYHDAKHGAMVRIALAPCSPFSVTGNLMKQSAQLARHYGVRLHTHLAETEDEEQFCITKFGYRPVAYMQSLDWIGEDVWFAHSVYVNEEEINLYAKTGCGVAHCPSSNMRLASGIMPLRDMLKRNVKIGLGVDGSASNDSSHMIAETRQALMLARLREGVEGASLSKAEASFLSARKALEIATCGGAAVLGREDVGSLENGKCADFVAINLNRIAYAGALLDPLAAVLFCAPQNVDSSFVHGRQIVRDGKLTVLDLYSHIQIHNKAAARLGEDA